MGIEQVYNRLVEVRKAIQAPVDTIGCHMLAKPARMNLKAFRFQVMTGLLLSSQTKDEVTAAAFGRLSDKFGVEFDAFVISKQHPDVISKLIKPVGFYRRKAEYLVKAAGVLVKDFDGDLPDRINDVMNLPGIGPKMAHLIMAVAWNQVTGIGVDVHVHRIANRLGWVDTDDTERTRVLLEGLFDRKHWFTLNPLLVGFGQTVCTVKTPKCMEKCHLEIRKECKYFREHYDW